MQVDWQSVYPALRLPLVGVERGLVETIVGRALETRPIPA